MCCDLYGNTLSANGEDLERWRREGRTEVLAQVGEDLRLWIDPETGRHLAYCPHFTWSGTDRGRCGLHRTKPAVCRAYPTAFHNRRCVMGVHF